MSRHDLLLRRRHEADCGLATFQALKRDWTGSYALVSRAVGVVGAREVIYRASTRRRGDVQIPESAEFTEIRLGDVVKTTDRFR